MLAPASGPRAHADAFVELQKVTHTYGRGDKEVRALESTDLRIEKGNFIALVGPWMREVHHPQAGDGSH
jgi:NitT/TauT family transport system ATP-binding protein